MAAVGTGFYNSGRIVKQGKQPLAVALYGLDERSYKTMSMFLQGPCHGVAVVVESEDAQIDIIDADHPTAGTILEERRVATPDRPVIVMSLEVLRLENAIYVKKPVNKEEMLVALKQVQKLINKPEKAIKQKEILKQEDLVVSDSTHDVVQGQAVSSDDNQPKKPIDLEEQKKTAKHKTAKQFNEGGFLSYLGTVPDIDFEDPEQVLKASYNPKQYFQGFVKSAFLVASSKGRTVQLNAGWKPLLIFPQSHEVWLDADDRQLRAFAGMPINNQAGNAINLSQIDINNAKTSELNKFQSMDAFLWKLAIWTSKGRYPDNIDLDRPVFLKRWPNMTRLVVTPHALRIAALLIQEPRTMPDIARVLNIKLQYVFVFTSACQAVALLGQAKRNADVLVQPAPTIKPTQSVGLFRKILNKLRSGYTEQQ
jgi:hypothetical protein